MRNGPSLVIRGTLFGSLVLALLGWFLAGHFEVSPTAEVAYAASNSQSSDETTTTTDEQPTSGDECELRESYPEEILQWCEIITEKARQAELPPNLIAALILQESGGDSSAYSSSGAVGLMQVMPRDGIECINGPCFASRPTTEELQDPGYNVEYGTNMLAGLIARHGNLREALKAYGPMDVGYRYADNVIAIFENYR
jgi:soluble lytic murein transglycosylase-like protein